MIRKTYHLKQMLWAPLLLIPLCGLAAKSMLDSALHGDSLSIYRIITLTGVTAKIAFLGLFVISLALVALGVFSLFASLQGKRTISVSKYSITVPKFSLRGVRHVEIPFASIHRIELQRVGNGVFVYIYHDEGKSAVAKAAFRSSEEFEEVFETLSAKANG